MFILPAKCPPGFTSEDGMTDCKPCGRNKYWVNATYCENCTADYITDVQNGVPDIEGCKGMSEMFMYSTGVSYLQTTNQYVSDENTV